MGLIKGRISSSKANSAIGYLELQETAWPEEAVLKNGDTCYIDDLTISHLQHLELLESFCTSGIKVVIGEETQSDALALRKYKRHLQRVEEHLVSLRQSLSHEIAAGKVSILANDQESATPDDDRRLWAHPTMSVFGSSTAPDAIVVDDRFLNRHERFDRSSASGKVFKSLDILKTLQQRGNIDDEAYFNSLAALRKRGHLFVPIEIEELRHHVSEAEIYEDRLVVGHDLLQIKAYYLLSRFSECLTNPDDVHWLLRSNRVINDVIREQWTGGKEPCEARAKSNWLLELVDLRVWANEADGAIQNGSVDGLWIANIVGLLAMPVGALHEERKAYLAWLDEDIIRPLKHKHPQLFSQIVRYSRDLINNMLTADEEQSTNG